MECTVWSEYVIYFEEYEPTDQEKKYVCHLHFDVLDSMNQ